MIGEVLCQYRKLYPVLPLLTIPFLHCFRLLAWKGRTPSEISFKKCSPLVLSGFISPAASWWGIKAVGFHNSSKLIINPLFMRLFEDSALHRSAPIFIFYVAIGVSSGVSWRNPEMRPKYSSSVTNSCFFKYFVASA